ncbi:MAG: inorganic phosphate transporter [candidate division Zixibacteria bacterium]|nr:inorganic phosphate transporter [candidate division Zixibacteria bacterium]
MLLIYLSSGLLLGWSLGANDAANVFGTAVGTRMVRFRTAAIICSLFVIIGAVISGAGATHTLGNLGSVNAMAGAFMVALSAAVTVWLMTRWMLPVSTSQAIVGAIIGWNLFTGSRTDIGSLTKIVTTWIASPILAAFFAIVLFLIFRQIFNRTPIHLLRWDAYIRAALIIVGAFGSYSLGANNIANVIGVFVPVAPFSDVDIGGIIHISGSQKLFLLGGIAISIGVFTYSHRVMQTVGHSLFKLSPITALAVVLSHAIVLFLFASEKLASLLISIGLPPLPLVPVSSSQAIVGAIIGIAIFKGIRGIKYNVLGGIALGWVTTPIIAGVITFISLFFLQNVFYLEVSREMVYKVDQSVIEKLASKGIIQEGFQDIKARRFRNPTRFEMELRNNTDLTQTERRLVMNYARVDSIYVDEFLLATKIPPDWFTKDQKASLQKLKGEHFAYPWEFADSLRALSPDWHLKPDSREYRVFNRELEMKLEYLQNTFRADNSHSE